MSAFITTGDGTLVRLLQEGGERFASIPEERRDTYWSANAQAFISGQNPPLRDADAEDEVVLGPSLAQKENASAVIDDD